MIYGDVKEQHKFIFERARGLQFILAFVVGYKEGYLKKNKKDIFSMELTGDIKTLIEREESNLSLLNYEEFEEKMHYILADSDDRIREIKELLKKDSFTFKELEEWENRCNEVLEKYRKYNYKKERSKTIIKNKMIITIIIMISILFFIG